MVSWRRASGVQRTSDRPRSNHPIRGALIFALVACMHLAVLALLALQTIPTSSRPEFTPVILSLASGPSGRAGSPGGGAAAPSVAAASVRPPPVDPSAAPASTQPSPPLPPVVVTPSPLRLPDPRPAAASSASVTAGSLARGAANGGGCNIEAALQTRLGGDSAVIAALRHLPPEARSVAGAVQLWDDGWITPAKLDTPELLVPVERAIVLTVAAAPPNCVAQEVRGPRLVILSDGDDTFIIGLGSGSWRWQDLLHPLLSDPSRR